MDNKLSRILTWVIIYSIAMAFLESAVVVYIREIYYPEGFNFPLKLIDSHIAVTELIRELATMFMLVAIAVLVGKTAYQRFAYFILSFAIWDIFYYVFLKMILNWPVSLLEWDVLFLLPFTWVGPVIAPVINSILMIILAIQIILIERAKRIVFPGFIWILLIVGSIVVIGAYTEDYLFYMSPYFNAFELLNPSNIDRIFELAINYIPDNFNWYIFSSGVLLHIIAIIYLQYRNRINE